MFFCILICLFYWRFIIYKLPKQKIGEVGSGVDYMYLDASVGSWQMSKFMVNSSQGAIANTLNQLYKGQAYQVREEPNLPFQWCMMMMIWFDFHSPQFSQLARNLFAELRHEY